MKNRGILFHECREKNSTTVVELSWIWCHVCPSSPAPPHWKKSGTLEFWTLLTYHFDLPKHWGLAQPQYYIIHRMLRILPRCSTQSEGIVLLVELVRL